MPASTTAWGPSMPSSTWLAAATSRTARRSSWAPARSRSWMQPTAAPAAARPAGVGAKGDDAAAGALRAHGPGSRAAEEERGLEVRIELKVPVVLADLTDVVATPEHRGQVRQHVE